MSSEVKVIKRFSVSVSREEPKSEEQTTRCDSSPLENVDYETAISHVGYGWFHIRFFVTLFVLCTAQMLVTGTTGFILPAAECDLELTTKRKSMLAISIYVGMILAAFPWGWLSDRFGRRRPLMASNAGIVASLTAAAFSPNYWVLFGCMVAVGALVIGVISVNVTFAAEMHSQKYRPFILMWLGLCAALAGITQSVLAMVLIPIVMPAWALASWRVFLLVCTVPSWLAVLFLLFLPESPRFLLSKGKTTEALRVLQRVYAANSGKEANQFPVKSLLKRHVKAGEGKKSALAQLVPLFRRPHLINVLYAITLQFLVLSCQNGIRMWMPQMFALLNVFEEQKTAGLIPEDAPTGTCAILDFTTAAAASNVTQEEVDEIFSCKQRVVPGSVYLNSVIIGAGLAIAHFITGLFAPRLNQRALFVFGATTAVSAALVLQAAPAMFAPFLAAGLQASLSITSSTGMAVCVDLFPTSIRSSAVSLTNMFGRVGSLVSNIVFPLLLTSTCSIAFYVLAGVMTVCCIIGFTLPVPVRGRNISVDFGSLENKPEKRMSIIVPPQLMRMRAASVNGISMTIVSLDSVNRFYLEEEEEEDDAIFEEEQDADLKATIVSTVSLDTVSTQVDKEDSPTTDSSQTLHM